MTKVLLSEIAGTLLKKKHLTLEFGLSQGLTGIALFLFHYSQLYNDESYYDAAFEILDGIHTRLSYPSQKALDHNLPEIGWLFLHLQQADMVDIDTDEVLQRIDDAAYKAAIYQRFKRLDDGRLMRLASYLCLRHQQVDQRHYKIKAEEALINIVDEMRLLYGTTLRAPLTGGGTLMELPAEHCLCVLNGLVLTIAEIYKLGITKHFIEDLATTIGKDICTTFTVHHWEINSHASLAMAVLALYTVTLLESITSGSTGELKASLLEEIIAVDMSAFPQPCMHDLVITIISLESLSVQGLAGLQEELKVFLHTVVLQDKPGYLGTSRGIPNLGIKGGLAGAGLLFLPVASAGVLSWHELLLLAAN